MTAGRPQAEIATGQAEAVTAQAGQEEETGTADGLVPFAYRYGCPASYDLPAPFIEQLWLAGQLWNALVKIAHHHDEAKAVIWRTNPAVAAAQDALDAAQAAVDECFDRIRKSRKEDRSTIPRDSDKEALRAAQAASDVARQARDAARKEARPQLRAQFAQALRDRDAEVKVLYPEFTGRGLGWATFNDVTRRRFRQALKQVEEARAQGTPAELRFRRWDGTGTLTVQVMRGGYVPPRTVPALNGGQHPRSGVFQLQPWTDPAQGRPGGRQRFAGGPNAAPGTMARLTIGRARAFGPLTLEMPVIVDRFAEAEAEVVEVKVTRFRQGTRYRVRVAVICAQPAAPPGEGTAHVAVRLAWTSAGNGAITVAHVGSSRPLPPPPASLAGVVSMSADGKSAEITYREQWRRLLERDADIESIRDQNLDVIKQKVVEALHGDPTLAQALELTAADVSRWRAKRRFAWLANPVPWVPGEDPAFDALHASLRDWDEAQAAWKAAHPVGHPASPPRGKHWRQRMLTQVTRQRGPRPRLPSRWPAQHPLAPVLRDWRSRDRHLWEFAAHESAQVLAARQDAWRCVAKWLCEAAAEIVLDGQNVTAAIRTPAEDREDPIPARKGRAQQHQAAPGELRAAIEAAAQRRGIPVTKAKSAAKSRKRDKAKGQ